METNQPPPEGTIGATTLVLSHEGHVFTEGTAVELPTATTLGLTGHDFTVEAWIRVDSFAGHFDKTVLGTDERYVNKGLHLAVRNGRPFLGFYGNYLCGETELEAGTWYHIAWRYNLASGEMAIFVNGVLDAQESGHAPFEGAGTLFLGRWSGGRFFEGRIGEVKIWSVARDPQAIQIGMDPNATPDPTGLQIYLTLIGGSLDDQGPHHHPTGEYDGPPIPDGIPLPPPSDETPSDETPSPPDTATAQDWLALALVDEDGNPMAGEAYRLALPDGSTREGTLDAEGKAHIEDLPSGTCQVSFPNLDAADWEPAPASTPG